jgi:hypothetical protein
MEQVGTSDLDRSVDVVIHKMCVAIKLSLLLMQFFTPLVVLAPMMLFFFGCFFGHHLWSGPKGTVDY